MWIRWSSTDGVRLLNTKHVAEFKVTSSKVTKGTLYELVAIPAGKDMIKITIASGYDKDELNKLVKHIFQAIEEKEPALRMPDLG